MRDGTHVVRGHASGPASSFGTVGGPITLLLYNPGSPSMIMVKEIMQNSIKSLHKEKNKNYNK